MNVLLEVSAAGFSTPLGHRHTTEKGDYVLSYGPPHLEQTLLTYTQGQP